MLGVEVVPASLFLILILGIPESPRWLIIKRNAQEKARRILNLLDPEKTEETIASILSMAPTVKKRRISFELFSKKYSFLIMLAVLFAFFNQLTGINAVVYYAPRIFELTGVSLDSALLSTAGIGFINLIFTLVGMAIIDRFGRKVLMYFGSVGLILALGLISRAFFLEIFNAVPILLFVYIGFFALSQGAVIWVFIAEIFPTKVRASGQSLGSFTHWLLAAIMTNAFPFFVNKFNGGPIFLVFFSIMIVQLLFVWKIMPETRNVSLEDLARKLQRSKD